MPINKCQTCRREFETKKRIVKLCAICYQKAWRRRHENYKRTPYKDTLVKSPYREPNSKRTDASTTRVMTQFDCEMRAIDHLISGKRGSYKWQ